MAEHSGVLHRRSTAGLAFLLMLVMILAALSWGAYKGWTAQRAQVEEAQAHLSERLATRQEVFSNILTVAARHLPADDSDLLAFRADRDSMGAGRDLMLRAAANERLTQQVGPLMARLRELPSIQADARDSMYVQSMLPQALEQSQSLVQEAAYSQQASDFNSRFLSSFSGRLARLLGVRPAEQFEPVVAAEVTP